MKLRCLIPLVAAIGCINLVPITDRPCPCADGWVCDTNSNTCVHELPPGPDAGSPGPDGSSSPSPDSGSSGSGAGSNLPDPIVMFTVAPGIGGAFTTFEFTISEPFVRIECQIDNEIVVSCSSPFETPPLPEGRHQLTVRATNLLGHSGSADARWTVDLTSPEISIDSGPSELTASTSATFTFGSDDGGARLTCALDGVSVELCISPAMFDGLADGSHEFVVIATDPAGNATLARRSWTVDTAPPVITFGAPGGIDFATPILHFSFTVTDAALGPLIECDTDGGGFAPCTSPYTPPALSDGLHTITVRSHDAAGNLGSATRTPRIDTIAPVVTIAAPSAPTGIVPSVAFTATDSNGLRLIECQMDGAPFARCTSPFVPLPLDNGNHTVSVRATDPAGNVTIESQSFAVSAPPNRHTIHIDGVNDFFSSDTRGEVLGTTSQSILAYVAWDNDNLYVGWEAQFIGDAPDPNKGFTIYVDADPGSSAGAASAQPFINQAATLPTGFLADYFLRWTPDGTITLAHYNGTTWTAVAATGVSVVSSLAFVEAVIPLAQLGSPSHLGVLGLWQFSGAGFERTMGGWYQGSFVDGDYRAASPAPIQHWLDVNMASPLPPNAPANRR